MLTPATDRAMAFSAAAIMITAALTACGSSTPAVSPATPIPLESAWHAGLFVEGYGPKGLGPAATASASMDPVQTTLAGLGITAADYGTEYSVKLMPNGDALANPFLRYCGARYPSEQNRTARRLMALYDSTNARVGPLSDAVVYDTSEHAAAALDELRRQLATCKPNTMIDSPNGQLVVGPEPSDGVTFNNLVPEAQRAVMTEVVSEPSTGGSARIQTLWQRNGEYVVSLTLDGDPKTPFTAAQQREFNTLAASIATRLSQVR